MSQVREVAPFVFSSMSFNGLMVQLRTGPVREWPLHQDSVPVGTLQIQIGLSSPAYISYFACFLSGNLNIRAIHAINRKVLSHQDKMT